LAMNYKYFCDHMKVIQTGIDVCIDGKDNPEHKEFLKQAQWALSRLEKIFMDKDDNIRRWLNKKSCTFISDVTGRRVEVPIGNDLEALYYFLVFCLRINKGNKIDEDFRDYLALVMARSVAGKEWSEC